MYHEGGNSRFIGRNQGENTTIDANMYWKNELFGRGLENKG